MPDSYTPAAQPLGLGRGHDGKRGDVIAAVVGNLVARLDDETAAVHLGLPLCRRLEELAIGRPQAHLQIVFVLMPHLQKEQADQRTLDGPALDRKVGCPLGLGSRGSTVCAWMRSLPSLPADTTTMRPAPDS